MPSIPPNEPMPQPQTTRADAEEEFIDLASIAAFVARNWGTLVAGVAVAMLCGAALFAVLPSRWQAQTTIEIGQVPAGTPVSGSRGVTLIEPPPQAAERLKQRELVNSALASLGIPTDQPEEPRAALFRHSVKATVVKNTNFIQVSGAGYSPEEARNNVAAAARVLMATHNKLMLPVVGRMMAQLEENTKRMAEAQTERARLKMLLDGAEKTNAKIDFAPNIVAVNQLANKDTQIQQIVAERAELQDTMSPSRTYPTRIIDAVYADLRPVFPKLPLFLAVAAILGLLAGIAVAWYRDRNRMA
jgi:uncharacterized protein involved in exopolysaccharide biosynthesis